MRRKNLNNPGMAILKSKDIAKMSADEMKNKLAELRTELVKARVKGKTGGKTNLREIKRTIAKMLTLKKLNQIKGAKKK